MVVTAVIVDVRSRIKTKRRARAILLYDDMTKKYDELSKDLLMNDRKWKEWLPIFEYADNTIKRECPELGLISQRVRVMIDD